MHKHLLQALLMFLADEDGQSITEYGAVIAFVGCIVCVAFSLANGTLFASITQAYSSTTNALSSLNNAALTAGS